MSSRSLTRGRNLPPRANSTARLDLCKYVYYLPRHTPSMGARAEQLDVDQVQSYIHTSYSRVAVPRLKSPRTL